MKGHLKYIVDHPVLFIILILAVTAFLGTQIPHLRFHSSIYDLTIKDLPANVRYKLFKEEFGSEEIIAVVAKGGDLFDPAVFEWLDHLVQRLSEIQGVGRVISLPGIKKDIDVAGDMSVAEFESILTPASLLVKTIISADKKTTVISLILEDIKNKDPVVDRVRTIIEAEKGGQILYQIGLPVVAQALAKYTEKDFLTLPPVTFMVIVLVLICLFRSLRGILVPVAALLTSLIWTFGLMALTKTPLAMLTMIVPIFLIAVGTAYCMHVFTEYRRAAREANTRAEAAFMSIHRVGFPTILAVFTTTFGLCSLLVNKITAIKEFAIFSSVGILSMLIIIFTLVPALLALLPLPLDKTEDKRRDRDLIDRILAAIIKININNQKVFLPLIAVIVLAALGGIFLIKVENNPVDYFKPTTPVSRHFRDIYQDMAGSIPVNVVIDTKQEEYFQEPARLKELVKFQKFLHTLEGVDKTESFADYLKLVNYAGNQFQKEYYALPEEDFEVRMLTNNFLTILGEDLLRRFMDPDFRKANILLRTHISSSRACLETEKLILDYVRQNFSKDFEIEVTGFGMVMAHSSHLLTKGQVQSLSITLVLIFGIMFFLFISIKVGLIAMIPNFFPIIMNFGLMGWLGLELSAATSLIASVAIGLAVDDTIHYLFRYNREFKKDLNKQRALKTTIEHVGRPIIFTTLTISLGFCVLLFSSFKPTTAFGLMMIITMISALVGDLLLLPALMLHMELVTIWDLLRLKLGKEPQEGLGLFQGLSRSQVHYVLMAGTLKKLDSGEVLFRKGETSDSMYAIISGSMDVLDYIDEDNQETSPDTQGPSRLVAHLHPGELVGEMGLVRSSRRTASVVARSPVELLELNRAMFKRLTWLYPPTAHRFFFNLMTVLCDRLEHTTTCLSQAATIDFITGLYYRSYFMQELAKELLRAKRYENPLCLLLGELDNYQSVWENHGSEAGEQALAEIGNILQRQLRCSDMACRWGFNQFAVMLANTPKEKALAAGERLAELVAGKAFRFNSETFRFKIHLCLVTLLPGLSPTSEDLQHMILKALVQAKKSGVNGVMEYEREI